MNLKIAIQKKGRLNEKSLDIFKECGITFENGKGELKMLATNFPIEILLLRDDDIPAYVSSGVIDLGIVGQNLVAEKKEQVVEVSELGFGECRLSIAVDKKTKYQSIKDLHHKKIATSYPNILNDYLNSKNVAAEIHLISGSVEIAPSIGLADAICDIVSTGSTLTMNGLKEVEPIFYSQSVLVQNPDLNKAKRQILDLLLFRLLALKNAKNNKYILLNIPNNKIEEIIEILPGIKSPTVVPLAEKGWSSVHTVVNENDFWKIIEQLKKTGAQGILVMPIEKMIL